MNLNSRKTFELTIPHKIEQENYIQLKESLNMFPKKIENKYMKKYNVEKAMNKMNI